SSGRAGSGFDSANSTRIFLRRSGSSKPGGRSLSCALSSGGMPPGTPSAVASSSSSQARVIVSPFMNSTLSLFEQKNTTARMRSGLATRAAICSTLLLRCVELRMTTGENSPPRYHVLLIGIDAYEGGPSLGGCVNDIDVIQQVLVDRLGVSAGRIKRL